MKLQFKIGILPLAVAVIAVSCSPASRPAESVSLVDQAGIIASYREWSLAQADAFLTEVEAFVGAVKAGDRAKAKSLYAPARMYFERIEPIAEALGDFDPRIDAREGDVKPEDWRGFHRLEKLLWSNDDLASGKAVADQLLTDTRLLRAQLETAEIDIGLMVTGSVELLNEVSTSKVTGEEERYSRTDLWDFQANVEGSAKIWELLKTTVGAADAALSASIDQKFGELFALLAKHRRGSDFKLYGELTPTEIKDLAAAVDALAEPLSLIGKHLIKA